MSMHNIEDFVECGVQSVAQSDLDRQTKRDLIHTLYHLQEYADCGFTQMRCTRQMVDCGYTFLFADEEMCDWAERADFYRAFPDGDAAYGMGELYRYQDHNGRFPEADGKLCVDSGSAMWEKMVAAGAITGDDAQPVRVLDIAQALALVRQEVTRIYGWDDKMRDDFLALFTLADAVENLIGRMSDTQVHSLLGLTRRQYESGDFDAEPDVVEPGVPFSVRGVPMAFSHCNETWPDYSHVYLGYHTVAPAPVPMWGTGVPLRALIVPENAPERINPFAENERPVPWLVHAPNMAEAAAGFFVRHTQKCKDYVDGKFSPSDRQFVDADELAEVAREYQKAGEEGTPAGLSARAAQIFDTLAGIIEASQPPAEPLPIDHAFVQLLLFFCVQAKQLMFALDQVDTNPGFQLALRRYLGAADRVLGAYQDRGGAGLPQQEVEQMLVELNDPEIAFGRRVVLLDRLWQLTTVPLADRLYLAYELHALLLSAVEDMEAATAQFRQKLGPVPDLSPYTAEIDRQLDALDQRGPDLFLQAAAKAYAEHTGKTLPDGWQLTGLRLTLSLAEGMQTAIYLYCRHPDTEHTVLVQTRGGEVGNVLVDAPSEE